MGGLYDDSPTRARRGRPPAEPRTADAVLIAAVRERIGCKLHQLAERMGLVGSARLSQANSRPLPPARRAELERMRNTPVDEPMLTDCEVGVLHTLEGGNASLAFPLSWRVLEAEGLLIAGTITPAGRAWVAAHPRTP